MSSAAIAFLAFLMVFVVIGALSALRSRQTVEDYYTAGKRVPPWLAALSAVATNNSGYMFIGMIGMTYTTGWSSIWLMIGWIAGDFLGSLFTLRKIRTAAADPDVQSFPQLLARWHGTDYGVVRRAAAVLTLVFLGAYAAAQLKAGSKALHVVFAWDMSTGAIIGAGIVLVYCIAGGIRASIWTDAAQSFVMIAAMGLLLVAGVEHVGGLSAAWVKLHAVSSTYMAWTRQTTWTGTVVVVVGWLFAGLAVLGQPHIVIRYMSFSDAGDARRIRWYYYTWFTAFYGATIGVGLLARLILKNPGGFDPELALPRMALALMPNVYVGFILAGLFAATMSTADSLVLACSAALSADLRRRSADLRGVKLATAAVVVGALAVAMTDAHSVFRLVLIAWGVLGAAFAPLVLVYAAGVRPSQTEVLAMMATGTIVFVGWRFAGFSRDVYELLPAFAAALAILPALRLLGGGPRRRTGAAVADEAGD